MDTDRREGLWMLAHLVASARHLVARLVAPLDRVAALPWEMVGSQGADLQIKHVQDIANAPHQAHSRGVGQI